MGIMRLRIVLLIVFVTCGLVHSVPVDAKESIEVSLEAFDIDKNELKSLKSNSQIIMSKNLQTPEEVNDTENEVVQESINSKSVETSLSVSCLHDNTNIQDSTSPVNTMNQNMEVDGSGPYYQVDYLKNYDRSGIGVGYYEGIIYPFVHPNLFAGTSPVSSVSYLPPVYFPRIYDPSLDGQALSSYITGGKPKHVRSVRSWEEDFMAELEHAAMMNNIIPTMPVQFLREAGNPHPQVYQAPVTAVFPQMVSGCSIPMLLSCSPKITRGSFERAYSGKHALAKPYG